MLTRVSSAIRRWTASMRSSGSATPAALSTSARCAEPNQSADSSACSRICCRAGAALADDALGVLQAGGIAERLDGRSDLGVGVRAALGHAGIIGGR